MVADEEITHMELRLPSSLVRQIDEEAEREERSRHAQILTILKNRYQIITAH